MPNFEIGQEVWVVTSHDTVHAVSFIRSTAELKAIEVKKELWQAGGNDTRVCVDRVKVI